MRQTHPLWAETVATRLDGLDQLGGQMWTFRALVLSPATSKGWPGSTCLVQTVELPQVRTLDQLRPAVLDGISITPGLTEGPHVSALTLPSGDSRRIDYMARGESGRDMFNSLFLVDTQTTLASAAPGIQLCCHSFEGYVDDWLTIAETFEFLPAEE